MKAIDATKLVVTSCLVALAVAAFTFGLVMGMIAIVERLQ